MCYWFLQILVSRWMALNMHVRGQNHLGTRTLRSIYCWTTTGGPEGVRYPPAPCWPPSWRDLREWSRYPCTTPQTWAATWSSTYPPSWMKLWGCSTWRCTCLMTVWWWVGEWQLMLILWSGFIYWQCIKYRYSSLYIHIQGCNCTWIHFSLIKFICNN